MADQAKVTSLDALEEFRSNLIIFVNKAHQSLDEVGDEVRRTRFWLKDDQRHHWDMEIRKRGKKLDEAKQELMRARLSGLRDSTLAQEEAVRKTARALEEAETKRRHVKRWTRDYDQLMDPLVKQLDSLRHILAHDMPKAIAFLVQAQMTLEAYTQTQGPPSAPVSTPTEPEAPQ